MTSTLEPHVNTGAARAAQAIGTTLSTGASQTRAKRIGDREKTAARLLRSSVERSYDAEVDIDWDEPWLPGKLFYPEHRLTLYGTRIWDQLSPEQRVELGKHEMVRVFAFGILVEGVLSVMLYRNIAAGNLVDDSTRYMLTEIGDETRHSIMFSRAVNKIGVEPALFPPRITKMIMGIVSNMPLGAWSYGWTLLFEEVLDRLQREAVADDTVQPHLRQLFKIHVLEEARHITFAREELVRSYQAAGRVRKGLDRLLVAGATALVAPLTFWPALYRRAFGISAFRGFLAVQLSENYRANAQFICEPMIRFFHEAGMIDGWFTKRIWKLSRALPDDVHEDVFGEPRKESTPSLFGRILRRLVGA
ncbi:conserved hypothetical protein [Segniliparus rotundus DSM 44985]|uniref:p-aminobenzoate N-oxygenase AurF n=1 Tax=Segniliparus rotundus (strain ATCC BAA-972 / CDC 1076 / CIP 108378 / DSM 44985 / JCM 13578) TaxID=640132 RepID=D6ZBS2_SEGRD|nr:diiron oxygenase [Segniliparus rotundus]ADG96899.1 conserved hypothetical protein [Segniliparus rotundus DSM 44985]